MTRRRGRHRLRYLTRCRHPRRWRVRVRRLPRYHA